jgi:glutathione S-transferase
MLTLYDFPPSPHCVRVRLALSLGGLEYRKVAMRLDGDQKSATFRALSPFGTVPVLVDGKTSIAQSYAALAWIGDRAEALLPRRGAGRARVLAWVAAAATELDPAVRAAYDEAYFAKKRDAKRVAVAVGALRAAMDRLERAREADGRGPYVAGTKPTIADAAVFPSLWLAKDWPRWAEWFARMNARAEVAKVIAEAEA